MVENKYMVFVSCMTYNHSAFIEEAMNGFCKQQTTFPFVCAIIDDASTDEEQKIISNYLYDHFAVEDKNITIKEETDNYELIYTRHKTNNNCYFVVLFLKYNHYKKKPKSPYVKEWLNNSKYVALCEGDDYWIDSNKLQKQVDFLENNLEFTMTCNRSLLYSVRRNAYVGESFCYDKDSIVKVNDVIYRTGLFISTCSIVYRRSLKENYPNYCRKCKVGDYPLQILAAMKGSIYYFNNIMSVYRIGNKNSWMGQRKLLSADPQRLDIIQSRIDMFRGFSEDYPQYRNLFNNKIVDEIRRNMPNSMKDYEELKKYILYFHSEISKFSLLRKIDFYLMRTRIPFLNKYYKTKDIFSKYSCRILKYKSPISNISKNRFD